MKFQGDHCRVESGEPMLDPDSFCPNVSLPISVTIIHPGQIDGRAWRRGYVDQLTKELVEQIVTVLRHEVEVFVAKNNPFSGYK